MFCLFFIILFYFLWTSELSLIKFLVVTKVTTTTISSIGQVYKCVTMCRFLSQPRSRLYLALQMAYPSPHGISLSQSVRLPVVTTLSQASNGTALCNKVTAKSLSPHRWQHSKGPKKTHT